MVCMGNICRSPTAHGVMRHLVQARGWGGWLRVDSCGTHAYHVGEAPDRRSQKHALQRGYDLSDLRARQLVREDFEHFDLVLVMDHENMARAQALCPPHTAPQAAPADRVLPRNAQRHGARPLLWRRPGV